MYKFFYIILFILFSNNLIASSFATVNFEKIFSNSKAFQKYLSNIEKFKKKETKKIEKIEKGLLSAKTKLDESQFILSKDNFEKELKLYENNVIEYQDQIKNINEKIFNNIENAKSFLSNEIIIILQNYAIDNSIEIIFDENNYIVAIKDIDITNIVIKEVNLKVKEISIKKL